MRKQIIKTVSFLFVVIVIALLLFGCNYLFCNNKDHQVFINYCVYVNKDTGEAYIYNCGRFEHLIGADGKPIVVNIDNLYEGGENDG